jgi:hypothetical protein
VTGRDRRRDRNVMKEETRREIRYLAMIGELQLIEIAKIYRITFASAYRLVYQEDRRKRKVSFPFSRN